MRRHRAAIGRLALGAWLGAIPACGDDGATMVGETPPPPATTGPTTSTDDTGPGTSTGAPIACTETAECSEGLFCVADFAVGDDGPGDFTCRAQCVPVGAVGLWCSDDASCCEGRCSEAPADPTGTSTGAGGASSGVCRLDGAGDSTSTGSGTTGSSSSSGDTAGSSSSDGSSSGSGSGTATD